MRIGKNEKAILDALNNSVVKGVANYKSGESRAVRSLTRKGLVMSYVNLSGVRVIVSTKSCRWCGNVATGTAYIQEDHTYPDDSCGIHGFEFLSAS